MALVVTAAAVFGCGQTNQASGFEEEAPKDALVAATSRSSKSVPSAVDAKPAANDEGACNCAQGEQPRAQERIEVAGPVSGERGRRLKLLYATQTATRPPRLRVFVNDPRLVTRDYGYWVENELRKRFELEGVPVSIDFVKSE